MKNESINANILKALKPPINVIIKDRPQKHITQRRAEQKIIKLCMLNDPPDIEVEMPGRTFCLVKFYLIFLLINKKFGGKK